MTAKVEPWLRGTHQEIPTVQRAVVHALELAQEDVHHWCEPLSTERLWQRNGNIAPVGFQIRHIARSLDRLLSYAEGEQLSGDQMRELKEEASPGANSAELLAEFDARVSRAIERVRAFRAEALGEPRKVGRKELPTSVGGLLVHVAEHTQRHVGQVITTAKLVCWMTTAEE